MSPTTNRMIAFTTPLPLSRLRYQHATSSCRPHSRSQTLRRPRCAAGGLSSKAARLLKAYEASPLYEPPASAPKTAQAVATGKILGPPALVATSETLVKSARLAIEVEFPGIVEPGGALYPPERARACWRDLGQFLAAASAVESVGGRIRPESIDKLTALYKELNVPLDAMLRGLLHLSRGARRVRANDAAAALELLMENLGR